MNVKLLLEYFYIFFGLQVLTEDLKHVLAESHRIILMYWCY